MRRRGVGCAKLAPTPIGDRSARHYDLTMPYRQLLSPTLREMVAQPGGDDFDFDPPRIIQHDVSTGRPVLMFLLDANVISELRRPTRANPRVAAWAESDCCNWLVHGLTVATRNVADFQSMGVSLQNDTGKHPLACQQLR